MCVTFFRSKKILQKACGGAVLMLLLNCPDLLHFSSEHCLQYTRIVFISRTSKLQYPLSKMISHGNITSKVLHVCVDYSWSYATNRYLQIAVVTSYSVSHTTNHIYFLLVVITFFPNNSYTTGLYLFTNSTR